MTDTLVPKLAQPETVLIGSSAVADHTEGMSYLETLPRRIVTVYLPLAIILIILLFPFYWMALTAIKPDEQLLDLDTYSPFWTWTPTFKHIYKLLFETNYPRWLWNTMMIAGRCDDLVDHRQRACGLCDRAAAAIAARSSSAGRSFSPI